MVTNAKVTVDELKKSAASAASTVKTTASAATKKAVAEVKKDATAAKKTVAKKATTAKKAATKKATTAKKTTKAKAKKVATTAVVQYQDREFTEAECIKKATAQFKKDYKKEVLEELNIYIKPEERKIYYVANKDRVGSVEL